MLVTKYINKDTQREVSIESQYKIICNGVKKTSNAKKTTSHKLDEQITKISNSIRDVSVNNLLQKKIKDTFYSTKQKEKR